MAIDVRIAYFGRGGRTPQPKNLELMTTTTHLFAGVNSTANATATIGHPILVAFDQVGGASKIWSESIRPNLEAGAYPFAMLDSGAFAAWKRGKSICIDAYVAFCLENGHLFDVIVNLDSIDGDLEYANANLAKLKAAGIDAMPVYHADEPLEQLQFCLAQSSYIGLGVAGTSPKKHRAFLDQVLPIIAAAGATAHGMKMSRYRFEYPQLATTDSSTWIAEYRAISYGYVSDFCDDFAMEMIDAYMDGLTRSDTLRLVVDSYDQDNSQLVEEFPLHSAENGRGQGRTAMRRIARHLDTFDFESFVHNEVVNW